jgi:crotonobetainyl-CoA:carnitine CoA-transferase CaiB-like acyl-CoA transferase
MQNVPSPLAGLKVLDLSQIMAGPYCTMVLADLGAEVIKVEKAGKGDDSRELGPYVDGESASFAQINRNKKGIVINLRDPQGRELLHELARRADVVVENFRVGVTKSLGVDYETLSRINPRLVYCSISGFGQTGPYAHKGGFDLVAQGMTGMMSMTGEAGGRPLKAGIAVYDIGAGITAVYAILAARIHQMTTGEGQHIDISLAECGLPWFIWEAAAYFANGNVPKATGSRHRVSAPYQAFRTGSGYIVIGAANQRTWERLCTEVLDRPELIQDPRFATNSLRLKHVEELERLLEELFAGAAAATRIARCETAGVPSGPINDFGQALDDPHYRARGMIQKVDHPIMGSMRMLGIPTKFSRTPGAVNTAAPTLGQHTDEVLGGLGLAPERIAQLREAGVVQ